VQGIQALGSERDTDPPVKIIVADYATVSQRQVLSRLVSVHGSPKYLRSDNGPEFVSRAVLKWLTALNIDTAHIDPGKPWQNGTNESFNGKFRDECLSMEWFRNRIDAKITIEQFRRQYNEIRPHSSLGQLTPVEFKLKLSSTNYPEQAIS
jgi:putative transposase